MGNHSSLVRRLGALETHLYAATGKSKWQVAWEEHLQREAEIDAHWARWVAEHFPDGLPEPVDESTLTAEERAERDALMRWMHEDAKRAAEELGWR